MTMRPPSPPYSSVNHNNCKIYVIICPNKTPYKSQQNSKELSQLAEQREARRKERSVKRDKTVRQQQGCVPC